MANIENTSDDQQSPRSELQVFFIKLGSVLAALLLFFVFSVFYIKSEIGDSEILRGGPDFWQAVERGLYRLADERDLPEAKKAKIIEALRKLSAKYGPYIEALTGPAKKN